MTKISDKRTFPARLPTADTAVKIFPPLNNIRHNTQSRLKTRPIRVQTTSRLEPKQAEKLC